LGDSPRVLLRLADGWGFRYLGAVGFSAMRVRVTGRAASVAVLLACAAAGLGACNRGAKTPEEAYARFAAAVRAGDAEKLYQTLDLETRWSWMTVRRAHREAYDIVLSNFPEGSEREQRSRRFEAAALSDSEARLFAGELPAGRMQQLAHELPAAPQFKPGSAAAEVVVPLDAGGTLAFRKGQDGRWGYAGFAGEADDRKRRASADLELIRNSAADYERAAARAGRTP
jgi:hypothetical protein